MADDATAPRKRRSATVKRAVVTSSRWQNRPGRGDRQRITVTPMNESGSEVAWVDAVNRGALPLLDPGPPFDAEELLAAALVQSGRHVDDLTAFGPGDFVEPLRVFTEALEADAALTMLGRWATRRYLLRLLDVRLQLQMLVEREPSVLEERIVEPVFVVGAPRTGTTVMHRLLAAAAGHRAALGWEFLRPVPPPRPDTHATDPRVASTADELGFPQLVSSGLRAIHTYSATMAKECLSAMAFACRTEEFVSRYHVPSYVDWLADADLTPAYDMHRLVLQTLQYEMPDARWVLKSPVHLQAVPTLVATYPDARFVVTHRDPAEVLASVSSLIATLRSAFSDRVDRTSIGRYHVALYRRSLDALVDHVDSGVLPADRTVHVDHADVVADAPTAVATVSDQLGLGLEADALAAIAELHTQPRDDALGAHRYDPGDFGLDPVETHTGFDRYRERFLGGVAR